MDTVIKTIDLRKVYKIGNEKVVALDCINLGIEKGQVCCILGTSGSGKSTLLNQLAGLEKPTRGEVYVKGKKISGMNERELAHFRQRNIGFVFQSYNLLQGMSAVENVAIPLTFRGMAKKKRLELAKEMLKAVGLGKRMWHNPNEMSGGQQQRVGIARAFVAKPDVVFADEPTGNLDTRTTREVMDLFLSFAREKQITIILVTHDQNLARYADRIVTIVDGNVINDRLNHSLYDITRTLRAQLDTFIEAEQWSEAAIELIHNAREFGEGVSVQALENAIKTRENPVEYYDKMLATLSGKDDLELFRRIGVDTGLLEKDAPAAQKALPQAKLSLPESTEPTEVLELVDATGTTEENTESKSDTDAAADAENAESTESTESTEVSETLVEVYTTKPEQNPQTETMEDK